MNIEDGLKAKEEMKIMAEFNEFLSNSFIRGSLIGMGYSIGLTIFLIIIGVKWDQILKALKISKRGSN